MNFNMMFKHSMLCIAVSGIILCTFAKPVFAAEEAVVLESANMEVPDGDILVVYSDAASEAEVEAVSDIVEVLTYQAFQVSFGKASECTNALQRFKYIICYDIDKSQPAFLQAIMERKKAGAKIMIIGNSFMKSYMDMQNKQDNYVMDDKKVGKITYYFDSLTVKEGLVEEGEFLFLVKGVNNQEGILEVGTTKGYVVADIGNITHMPVSDMQNKLVKAIFAREVAYWKWMYAGEPHAYAQYIVLNEVYPFQEPEKLMEVVNLMVEMQVPFVISVMPVYVNGDYPAMQRFCEILRYAQDNGGTIIMHSPINQKNEIDAKLMDEYITMAIQYYINQEVYPMALQVPSAWMYDENAIEILSHFGTIFTTNEEDKLVEFPEDKHTNEVYADGHQWVGATVALDYSGVSYTKTYSTAVYIGMEEDSDIIREKINACRNSFVPLKSLWDIEHNFWTEEDQMSYDNRIITLNGERKEKNYQATVYEEEYDYHRNMLKKFSKDLAEENRKLVIAVVIVSSIFLIFLLIARYNNKRKFFIKKDKE